MQINYLDLNKYEFHDDEIDELITNHLYLEQVENMIHEEIDKNTIQCNTKQQEK
jgi:hypothetical protein